MSNDDKRDLAVTGVGGEDKNVLAFTALTCLPFCMSLINEALKQAQRETQGDNAPAIRDAHVSDATRDVGGSKFPLVLAALVVAAGAGGAFWFFGGSAPAVPPAPPKVVETTPAPVAPAPVVAAKPPVEPPAAAVEPPVAKAPEVAPVVAVATLTPAAAVETPPAPVRNAAIEEMVSLMRLSLVRKATSRAVIDGVVVKVGDRLSEQPLLILVEVTDGGVLFRDAAGLTYEKRLK